MARRTARSDSELREVLLETYAANEAMNISCWRTSTHERGVPVPYKKTAGKDAHLRV
jgi:hypothetical protein